MAGVQAWAACRPVGAHSACCSEAWAALSSIPGAGTRHRACGAAWVLSSRASLSPQVEAACGSSAPACCAISLTLARYVDWSNRVTFTSVAELIT